MPGYEGVFCDDPYCKMRPCVNGGVCESIPEVVRLQFALKSFHKIVFIFNINPIDFSHRYANALQVSMANSAK